MKRALLILAIVCISTLSALGQESGNRGVYGRTGERNNPSNGVVYGAENKDLVNRERASCASEKRSFSGR
jgi:hypothetical protein